MLTEKREAEKQALIETVSKGGFAGCINFFELPEEKRRDRDITLAAVKNWGPALEYADEEHRQDKDIVKVAVKSNPLAIKYAGSAVSSDFDLRPLWIHAACTRGREGFIAFEQAPRAVRADREVAMAAVTNVGYALELASDALQADKDVVMAAVQNDPLAIQFAHRDLQVSEEMKFAWMTAVGMGGQEGVLAYKAAPVEVRGMPEVALAAIASDARALEYAPDSLREDGAFVLEAASFSPDSPRHARPAALADPEIRRLWLSKVRDPVKGKDAYAKAPQCVRSDVDITLEAVSANGMALEFADPWLRSERTVVLAAVTQQGKALGFADDSLREDSTFVLEAAQKSPAAITKAHAYVQADPDLAFAWEEVVAAGFGGAYDFRDAPEEVRGDWDVALVAVRNCARALSFVAEGLLKDAQFVAEALEANPAATKYAAFAGVE